MFIDYPDGVSLHMQLKSGGLDPPSKMLETAAMCLHCHSRLLDTHFRGYDGQYALVGINH